MFLKYNYMNTFLAIFTWSRSQSSGESPACAQKMVPSMTAAAKDEEKDRNGHFSFFFDKEH